MILPCWQQHDLQLREVVQSLLHLELLTPELVLQLLVPELDIEQMPKLVGLQLVVLPVVQLVVLQLAQLAARQLLGLLVVQVHSQVLLVEWQQVAMQQVAMQQVAMQQLQNSSLVQILELGESPLLMHQQQVLWLMLELLELPNLVLLVSMF